MFKEGKKQQQKTIFDFDLNMSQTRRNVLKNSWAGDFFDSIFLQIDESKFACLYSDTLSRPNAPINLLISLLIIKDLESTSDEGVIEGLYFDQRYHYALGISDIEKERICINTISNFSRRLCKYETETGIDLLGDETKRLSILLAKQNKINTSIARMDSLMISSNAKRLTRLELAFRVIKDLVKMLSEKHPELLDDKLTEFQKKEYEKEILYRTTSNNSKERLNTLVKIAYNISEKIKKIPQLREFKPVQMLLRFVDEQCVVKDNGEVLPKDSKQMHSQMLLTPTDPEATFRKKRNDTYVGYVGNVLEVRDEEKDVSLILDHDLKQNIYSDTAFIKDTLKNEDIINEVDTICVDGAYYSDEVVVDAEEVTTKVNFSAMTGTTPKSNKIEAHKFKLDGETCTCPAGIESFKVKKNDVLNSFSALFFKSDCESCEFKDICYQTDGGDFSIVHLTRKQIKASETRAKFGTEEHIKLSNFRAGVEGVPSVLRRFYRVDKIPVYGLVRKKLWFSTKIIAKNIKSLTKYRVETASFILRMNFVQIPKLVLP
jgi:hypothetical protein